MGILDDAKIKIIEQVIWAERELRGKSGAEKKAAVVKKWKSLKRPKANSANFSTGA